MTSPIAAPPSAPRLRAILEAPLLLLVVAVAVGFLLVGQIQGPTERLDQPLEAESEGDLARILAGLNSEADALQAEISELKVQLSELQRSSQSEAAAADALEQELRSLEVLAGTVPVTGPGVVMTVNDAEAKVTYDALIDVVQELRDAGAEAIAVNDLRVGVASPFGERDGRVTLDGTTLRTPYRVAAIGQPATLDGGLKIPGGAVDALSAVPGVRIEVARQARLELPALARPPTFRRARPIGSDS